MAVFVLIISFQPMFVANILVHLKNCIK